MSVEAHQYKKAIYNLKYKFKLLELDLMNLDCHSGLKWKNGAIKNIVLPTFFEFSILFENKINIACR